MNDTTKGEQALRVLDAIEAELEAGTVLRLQCIGGRRFLVEATQSGRMKLHRGSPLLDALAQYAQTAVSEQEDEAEPLDAALERYTAEGML